MATREIPPSATPSGGATGHPRGQGWAGREVGEVHITEEAGERRWREGALVHAAALAERARALRIGDPWNSATQLGPLISSEHRDKVLRYYELARDEGAEVLAGGGVPTLPEPNAGGWYIEPTVWTALPQDARCMQEEVFGPVAAVIPFKDEADALQIANDSKYGLAAAVWTRDIFKAIRRVKALGAGIVWVNHMHPTYVEAPWGGYKQSGFGRELGKWGIEELITPQDPQLQLRPGLTADPSHRGFQRRPVKAVTSAIRLPDLQELVEECVA